MSGGRQPLALDRRLGARVRARRLAIGMSQERLAEMIGLTFQQVQKYEKGVNRIAASRLFDISVALDLPIAAFFEDATTRTQGPSTTGSNALERALAIKGSLELVTLYASLKNASVRQRVLALVRAMSEGGA